MAEGFQVSITVSTVQGWPSVRAAVPMSGTGPMKASVPIQFQTSDYDGQALAAPAVLGVPTGS